MAPCLPLLLSLALTAVSDRHVGWFPAQLVGATRVEAPQVWDRQTVFDYMDGKAEIYLTYAFRQVTTAGYQLGGQRVEAMLFDLTTPAEAFGMFSNDLTGERLAVMQDLRWSPGLLRGWQGPLLLRIEGQADLPELRGFAVALAEQIAAHQPAGESLPPLTAALPRAALALHDLRFFHELMCFSGFFYVSTKNVLGLDAQTDGLFAEGSLAGQPLKVLLVQYPSVAARDAAWDNYVGKVLTAKAIGGPDGPVEELDPGLFSGARRVTGPQGEARLVLCFEAASLQACQQALAAMVQTAGRAESRP